ncbi:MAG: amidohydrolase family protein, partial [Spirochaetes bacterium]|nr:amidohydrolase family protein [Spirochaetota bacterium]
MAADLALADSHVHFSDHRQLDGFKAYLSRFAMASVGVVSLPDFERMNFNPEALFAKLSLPETVFAFGGLDYSALLHDVVDEELDLAAQVRELHGLGFDGIKLWAGKPHFQARTGLRLDGIELAAAFREAGRRGMPVVVHVADPPIFWEGIAGGINEELGIRYDRPGIPSFESLQEQAARISAAHPETTFIFAHLLFRAGDIGSLSQFMEEHPNALVDLAPGLYFYADLSQRREEALSFFSTFRERVLFGTDGFWFAEHMDHLPRRSLSENAQATERLLRFLTTEERFDNPFAPTRETVPEVVSLGLPSEVTTAICRNSFAALV